MPRSVLGVLLDDGRRSVTFDCALVLAVARRDRTARCARNVPWERASSARPADDRCKVIAFVCPPAREKLPLASVRIALCTLPWTLPALTAVAVRSVRVPAEPPPAGQLIFTVTAPDELTDNDVPASLAT